METIDEAQSNSVVPGQSSLLESRVPIKVEPQTPKKIPENANRLIPETPRIPKVNNMHCDFCLESFSLKIDLAKHYSTAHFQKELEKIFSEYFTDDNFCIQCEIKPKDSKEGKLEHVGQKHKKVFVQVQFDHYIAPYILLT